MKPSPICMRPVLTLAAIPLDVVADVEGAIKELVGAGFEQLRLTIEKAPASERCRTVAAGRGVAAAIRSDSVHQSVADDSPRVSADNRL